MSWTIRDLLIHGHPSEILPEQHPLIERAAWRYAADPHLSKADRDRIARVWLPTEPEDPEPIAFVFPEGGR